MIKGFLELEAKHQTMLAIVLDFAVIAFWRGMWGLMDLYFFPYDYELSLWLSVVLGLIIVLTTHLVTKQRIRI